MPSDNAQTWPVYCTVKSFVMYTVAEKYTVIKNKCFNRRGLAEI